MKIQSILFAALILATPVASQTDHRPYQGLETRDISSLSDEDIEALQSGSGWGLALPAELNGYPGPAHVLELSDKLGLSDQQMAEVQAVYDAMKADAVATGRDLIEAEHQLDQGFKSNSLTASALTGLIAKAETARAELRFIHLSRHLETKDLLTDAQISEYSALRGYTSDPCQSVPQGHDAEMWRRHNGCSE